MQACFQGGGDLDHAGALVGSGLPGGAGVGQVTVAGDVAGAVRVSVGELDRVGVTGSDDDAAEVMHGVVQSEDGRLLAAVRGTGGGEAAVDLVCGLPLHPGAAERVDELLELAGDVAETGRRAEDHRVGPEDVASSGFGDVLRLGRVACPARVGGNRLVGSELVNLAQPDFGPRLLGALDDGLRQFVHGAGRGVVDDGDLDVLGHGVAFLWRMSFVPVGAPSATSRSTRLHRWPSSRRWRQPGCGPVPGERTRGACWCRLTRLLPEARSPQGVPATGYGGGAVVPGGRVVDHAEVHSVDPVPQVDGQDELPAEVVAEEADVGGGEVHAWNHEDNADGGKDGAEEQALEGGAECGRAPPQERVDRGREHGREDNPVEDGEDATGQELNVRRCFRWVIIAVVQVHV